MKTKLIISLLSIFCCFEADAQNWSLSGNAATTATQYVGTKDAKDLRLNTNGVNRMTISSAGYTGFNILPESISRVFSNQIVPGIIAQNSFYSGVKGRITNSTARSNGYLGVYTSQAITISGLPPSINYMGVLGINETGSSNGVGVVGWNKNIAGGGTQYGVYGFANGNQTGLGNVTDKNVGVFGRASGNIGNIGVWGQATGAGDYAGYFNGRGYFSDKVGIGTESPGAMLSINAPAGTTLLGLSSNNASKFLVNSSGNVGIGTAAPGALLHVNGTGECGRFNAATFPYLTFHNNNVEKAWIGCNAGDLNLGTSGTNATGNVNFYANTNVRMSIMNNGRVGIGNTNPAIDTRLTVDHTGITQAVFGSNGTGVSILSSYPGIAFNSYYTTAFKAIKPGFGFDITCDPTSGQLLFRTHNNAAAANGTQSFATRMTINNDGRVVIGNIAPATNYLLSVDGRIMCEELKVQNSGNWPDYVFNADYKLASLTEVENHINEKGFLPGMPSACEAEENGVGVGDMQKKLLEKIEELTLYVISLEKKVNALESK
ncbi:MAG: hypothetical protein ABI772_01680 [Bacteroidota bacterium]